MVEPQPSKLIMRVRSPSPAPLNRRPQYRFTAHVAQSVEHFLGKEEVEGSIPFVSTSSNRLDSKPVIIPQFA